MASSPSTASGAVALLDLPLQSAVGFDGHVIVLQRDDFVGIHGVPSDDSFHLMTARPASTTEKETLSALTCGFILYPAKKSDWIVTRRYDPRTEEVGSAPLDPQTTENLVKQVERGQMQQRVVPYTSILPTTEIDTWKKQTSFISDKLLAKRGLCHGDKVVPGCYEDDETNASSAAKDVDGKSLVYPPIPVLEDSSKLKRTSHLGTKRYLAHLSPADRTALFLDDHPSDRAFSDVLTRYYDGRWEDLLGDIQLSYVMFLHIQCLASLEHWRDLVAMTSTVLPSEIAMYKDLFSNLLQVLETQVMTMEQDFFEDIEFSGNNFFIPAIERLCSKCSKTADAKMADSLSSLTKLLSTRFPSFVNDGDVQQVDGGGTIGKEKSTTEGSDVKMDPSGMKDDDVEMSDGESDSDSGPVVVPSDEVQASFARLSQKAGPNTSSVPTEYSKQEREAYQLLFASKMEHEDVLMACARILDEANDVSLVREAAAYLEEVEAKR